MARIVQVLSEVTTRTGTTRLVLVYDDATLEVQSLTLEGKGDPNTLCEAVLREKALVGEDERERERKTTRGEDASFDVTGLRMRPKMIRGKMRLAPDFPRPEFRTWTRQAGRTFRTRG